jgi:hypothetical protein
LKGTHRLLLCADDVNILVKSINTARKSTKALLEASREVGLEVTTEKTKYMVVTRHQNVGQDYNLLIANKCFESMTKFKYLETAVKHQSCIHEEIKSRLNSRIAWYHSVQNPLSSRLLFENLQD